MIMLTNMPAAISAMYRTSDKYVIITGQMIQPQLQPVYAIASRSGQRVDITAKNMIMHGKEFRMWLDPSTY